MAITLDPAAAAQALGNILGATSQGAVETVRMVAGDYDERARRHAAIAERLAATLGEQDGRVLALRQSSDHSRRLATDLTRAATMIAPNRVPEPGSFTFTGRVMDATGAFLPGVHARLSDRAGTLRIAGSAVTDEVGTFFLVVPAGAAQVDTESFLVVEDAQGRVLHVSPDQVRFQEGVLQRIDLAVEAKLSTNKAPPPSRGPRTRAGRRGGT